MRITTTKTVDPYSFQPIIHLFKDGEHFVSLKWELIEDIKYAAKIHGFNALDEIVNILQDSLKDPSLDSELVTVLTDLKCGLVYEEKNQKV
jgi:hypothetical protein